MANDEALVESVIVKDSFAFARVQLLKQKSC